MERLKCDQSTDSKAGRRHDQAGLETDVASEGGRGWVGTEGLTRMGHVIKEALQKDCSSCPAEKSVEKVISGCHETS